MPNPRIHQENFGGFAKITFDVSLHGGQVGDHELALILPKNSIVIQAFSQPGLDVQGNLAPVSSPGSALVTLSIEGQGDLLAANTGYGQLTGYIAYPVAVATPIITTAKRQLILNIADRELDSGIVDFFIDYRHGQSDGSSAVVPPAAPPVP